MRLISMAFVAVLTVWYAPDASACGCKGAKQAGAGCGATDCAGGCGGGCDGGCGWVVEASAEPQQKRRAVASKVQWRTLEEARREARASGLPMLVHFSHGRTCEHCRQRVEQVFRNDEVAALLNAGDRAIPVRIHLASMGFEERRFGNRVGYGGDCMLVMTDADGHIVDNADGTPRMTRGVPDADAVAQLLRPLVN